MRLIIFFTLILGHAALAQEVGTDDLSQRLRGYHGQVGGGLRFLAERVDRFFVNSKNVAEVNRTNLRLYQVFSKVESKQMEQDFSYRLNIDLPNLEKRFRFSLERRRKNDNGLNSEGDENLITEVDREETSRGGFSFLMNDLGKFDVKLSSGVRIDIPPTPFAELKVSREFVFEKMILNTYANSFWSYRSGYGQSLAIDINTSVTDDILFRFVNEATWLDSTDRILLSHGPSFYHSIGSRHFLAFNARANYSNRPSYRLENYDLTFNYRYSVIDQILYFDTIPGLGFPRSRGFRRTPRIAFKLELVF